jgi:hypothetical protein
MAHFPFFWRVWQKFEIYGTFSILLARLAEI